MRSPRQLLAGALTLAATLCFADDSDDGAISFADAKPDYAACSACHQPTGAGVPGAFPPLRNRVAAMAKVSGGREYLMTVVAHGLIGPMQAGGMTYMGVMPGHTGGMSDEQMANALNYAIFELNDEPVTDVQPVTAEEVTEYRESLGAPSLETARDLRTGLVAEHGDAWP